jgi:predicted transcriptional regulator of viral defense system
LQQSNEARLLELLLKRGAVRPREVEALGIAREYLLRLMRKGVIERQGRGVYRLSKSPISAFHSMVEVSKRVPNGTICLLSALVFHEMTTQNPHEIWLAVAPNTREPQIENVELRVFRFSKPTLSAGQEEHQIEGVPVRIYSPAKTIADCFRFRNRIGLDVALEALRLGTRKRKASLAEIRKYASICRVSKVIQPYLDSLQ